MNDQVNNMIFSSPIHGIVVSQSGDGTISWSGRYKNILIKQTIPFQSDLMQGAQPTTTPSGYAGQWYQLPDGSVFGIRTSSGSGTTIDVIQSNVPGIPNGFKVHQQ